MRRISLRAGLLALAAAVLTGCASWVAAPLPPLLRLAPDALGQTLALQQQLTLRAGGHTRHIELALEADAQSVRAVMLELGQVVARFEWDGSTLQQERVPGWPDAASGERVLNDLQLVYWPAGTIAAALPAGWHLHSDPGGRTLRRGTEPVVHVRYPAPLHAELDNVAAGYRLVIRSQPFLPAS